MQNSFEALLVISELFVSKELFNKIYHVLIFYTMLKPTTRVTTNISGNLA